jgi:thiamine biosynthesis lipoprotein
VSAASRMAVGGLQRVEHVMGMPISIDVRDADADSGALDLAFEWFRLVDQRFSTYQTSSEISRLNRGRLDLKDAHPDVQYVLRRCEEIRTESDGYFDTRAAGLPDEVAQRFGVQTAGAVDPSGFVKGWSVDRAAEILEDAGIRNFSINAGGDALVRGRPGEESHWRIGIQHPLIKDKLAAVVPATDLAIATSGTYERGAHIIDPYTGAPPAGVLSVSIVGPELGTADAYATAAFAMGVAGPAWTAGLTGFEAMTILEDERVLRTPGFPVLAES